MEDTYLTIAAPSQGEYKDRGSKFLAYAFPVGAEADWQARLEDVRKLHPKARHHCFAFRLGLDKNCFRANDDGEPAGSAGRPILGQIDAFGLTNVLVVVARYFGGTLLGVPGLIAAYKGSAHEALAQAQIVQKTLDAVYEITFDYALTSNVMQALKQNHFTLLAQSYDMQTARIICSVRLSHAEDSLLRFKAAAAGLHLEQAAQLEQIPGLQWRLLYVR